MKLTKVIKKGTKYCITILKSTNELTLPFWSVKKSITFSTPSTTFTVYVLLKFQGCRLLTIVVCMKWPIWISGETECIVGEMGKYFWKIHLKKWLVSCNSFLGVWNKHEQKCTLKMNFSIPTCLYHVYIRFFHININYSPIFCNNSSFMSFSLLVLKNSPNIIWPTSYIATVRQTIPIFFNCLLLVLDAKLVITIEYLEN